MNIFSLKHKPSFLEYSRGQQASREAVHRVQGRLKKTGFYQTQESNEGILSLYYLLCNSNTFCQEIIYSCGHEIDICELPAARVTLRITDLAGGSS